MPRLFRRPPVKSREQGRKRRVVLQLHFIVQASQEASANVQRAQRLGVDGKQQRRREGRHARRAATRALPLVRKPDVAEHLYLLQTSMRLEEVQDGTIAMPVNEEMRHHAREDEFAAESSRIRRKQAHYVGIIQRSTYMLECIYRKLGYHSP